MKREIKFNTQICTTVEQSKRLLGLGLDDDTADMLILPLPNGKELIIQKFADESGNLYYKIKDEQWESSPAWSLHRLIAMLPDFFSNLGRQFNLKMDKCFLRYCTARNDEYIYFQQKDTLYDNIIDCIEWLIKENKFNKEYLKEE